MWELIILVTHATFDAVGWSNEPQLVQSIHNGVSVISKDFNFVFFVKKKTLQESLSVQMFNEPQSGKRGGVDFR